MKQEEKDKSMMDRKSTIAEIILSFVILMMLNGIILLYCKLFKKDNIDERMISEVNE